MRKWIALPLAVLCFLGLTGCFLLPAEPEVPELPLVTPYSGAEYDLLRERFDVLPEGIPVSKPTVGGTKADSLYKSLLNAGESLLRIVREARGKPNKTLQHFTDDLNALIKKYK